MKWYIILFPFIIITAILHWFSLFHMFQAKAERRQRKTCQFQLWFNNRHHIKHSWKWSNINVPCVDQPDGSICPTWHHFSFCFGGQQPSWDRRDMRDTFWHWSWFHTQILYCWLSLMSPQPREILCAESLWMLGALSYSIMLALHFSVIIFIVNVFPHGRKMHQHERVIKLFGQWLIRANSISLPALSVYIVNLSLYSFPLNLWTGSYSNERLLSLKFTLKCPSMCEILLAITFLFNFTLRHHDAIPPLSHHRDRHV